MIEDVPGWLQIVVALAALFGAKELALAAFNWVTGRRKEAPQILKLQGEAAAMELSNEKARLDHLDQMTEKVKGLLMQSEKHAEEKAQLKSDLDAERIRVARREGVIDYQKEEIRDLHEEVRQVREEMATLAAKMENLQRSHDNMTTLTMRQTAILEQLKSEGKWEGFPENGTAGS